MRNLLFTIQYDGTAYHGFQVQRNAITVCEVFQDAVESVLGKRWDVKGCSRTDTGVHAKDYKLSMKLDHQIPTESLQIALNRILPVDIGVKEIREVPLNFHARYDCTSKEYTYYVRNSRVKDPFHPTQSYLYPWAIDEAVLHAEAQQLVGTHDFSAFCTEAHLLDDAMRTITKMSVTRRGETVIFRIEGDGFLRNMVRILVGSLLYVAAGKIPEGKLTEILQSKNRNQAGKTAPAHGLYLTRVDYPDLWEEQR